MDRLGALEQRMNALLGRLEECKVTIAGMTEQNAKLRAESKETEALRKESRQIQARINQLEKELKVQSTRAADTKAKIKATIQRIDALENEIARM
jgi:septal ring factor EnvC (AmiA/AmiB activator)